MSAQEWGLVLLVVSQVAATTGAVIAGFNKMWKAAAIFTAISVTGFVSEMVIGWDALTW